ncbi:MAG: heme ABC exporter ATP-binding protein CcmA [Candidatus Tectomicrobia bacterium]|nr:heme ABC exporter ATP-binding protein CcmA [Candidatus Tectomicrobia bacterium]
MWSIETSGLTKRFSQRWVLRGIDLQVKAGEFVSLLGSNGAGKTTLIKILSTLMQPSGGVVKIAGLILGEEDEKIRQHVGLLSHSTYLYDELTAYENLLFYGKLRTIPTIVERTLQTLKDVGLSAFSHSRVRTFSSGMRKRLAIAKLLLAPPEVIFLDEPYAGLDREGIEMLNHWLMALNAEGRTIFMVTHNNDQARSLGARCLFLSQGKLTSPPLPSSSKGKGEGEFEERTTYVF